MPEIHQRIYIKCNPDSVFEALTTQSGLSSWWTPHLEMQLDLCRFYFGESYFKEMKIVQTLSNESVKWKCIQGAEEWIQTNITFKLLYAGNDVKSYPEMNDQINQSEDQQAGTILDFRHNDWKNNSDSFAECSYTWGRFLRSLKLYCETGKGNPWPHQHTVFV